MITNLQSADPERLGKEYESGNSGISQGRGNGTDFEGGLGRSRRDQVDKEDGMDGERAGERAEWGRLGCGVETWCSGNFPAL